MNIKFKVLFLVALFIFLICAFAFFQAYVTKAQFIDSLDGIILIIIGEGWKFLSTPTIFISGLIFLFLWNFRDKIEKIFPSLEKSLRVVSQQNLSFRNLIL